MNKDAILWLFGMSIAMLIIVALGLNMYSLHFHAQLLSTSGLIIMLLGLNRDDFIAENRLVFLMLATYITFIITKNSGFKDVSLGIGLLSIIARELKRGYLQ